MNAIGLYRIARWAYLRRIPLVPAVMRVAIFAAFNSVIPAQAKIGKGTYCGHGGIGVVIHPLAVIGDNVLIGQGVTIGGRQRHAAAPCIGNDVYVGAGARILGNVNVGDGSVIGANAVVLSDVPPGSTVVGVPARTVRTTTTPDGTTPH